MMKMTPDQLKAALSKPSTAPKPEKKSLLAKIKTPSASPDKPFNFTRFQLKKRKENEEKTDPRT
jgi:hypothetical protein